MQTSNTSKKICYLSPLVILERCFIVLSLVFLSLIPVLFWFQAGVINSAGEITTFVDLTVSYFLSNFQWDAKTSQPNIGFSQFWSYYPFQFVRQIGFSRESAMKFALLLPYMLKPLCFYISLLWCFGKRYALACLAATFFYCLSPFELLMGQGINRQYFCCAVPIFVVSYIKLLHSQEHKVALVAVCLMVLSSTMFAVSSGNPTIVSSVILLMALVSIGYFDLLKRNFFFIFIAILGIISINLGPLLTTVDAFSSIASNSISNSSHSLFTFNSLTEGSLVDSVRFLGSWALRNDVYNPYWKRYDSLAVLVVSLVPITLVLMSLAVVSKSENKRLVIIFFFAAVLFLFIAKGNNPPFGSLVSLFYSQPSLLTGAFRSPWAKFLDGYVFVTAFLAVFSIDWIIKKLSKYSTILCAFSFNLLFVFLGWNYVIGDTLINGIYTTNKVAVPERWIEFQQKSTLSSYKPVLLPSLDPLVIHQWEHGIFSSTNMANYLSFYSYANQLPLSLTFTRRQAILNDMITNIELDLSSSSNIKKLDYLGVNSVHFVKDIDWDARGPSGAHVYPLEVKLKYEAVLKTLEQSGLFQLAADDGPVRILNRIDFDPSLLNSNKRYFDQRILDARLLNPDSYIYEFAYNGEEGYSLFLNENYNPNWKLKLASDCGGGIEISGLSHQIGDYNLNVWKFNLRNSSSSTEVLNTCATFSVNIVYDAYLDKSIARGISMAILFASIGFLFYQALLFFKRKPLEETRGSLTNRI